MDVISAVLKRIAALFRDTRSCVCVNTWRAPSMLIITPHHLRLISQASTSIPTFSHHAGTIIYGFPNHSDTVLKIDTTTDTCTFVGGPDVLKAGRHRVPQDGKYKYLGGALGL